MNHEFGFMFKEPVDPVKLRILDYAEEITQPMDLGTVCTKLKEQRYRNVEEFTADVHLTFDNAIQYNAGKSGQQRELSDLAKAMKRQFDGHMAPRAANIPQRGSGWSGGGGGGGSGGGGGMPGPDVANKRSLSGDTQYNGRGGSKGKAARGTPFGAGGGSAGGSPAEDRAAVTVTVNVERLHEALVYPIGIPTSSFLDEAEAARLILAAGVSHLSNGPTRETHDIWHGLEDGAREAFSLSQVVDDAVFLVAPKVPPTGPADDVDAMLEGVCMCMVVPNQLSGTLEGSYELREWVQPYTYPLTRPPITPFFYTNGIRWARFDSSIGTTTTILVYSQTVLRPRIRS